MVYNTKLRMYDILEAKILILLSKGDQQPEDLDVVLGIQDEPDAKRSVRLALGSLVEKGLIQTADKVPGITLVKELRSICVDGK